MKYTINRTVESQYNIEDIFIYSEVFREKENSSYYNPRLLLIEKVSFRIDSDNNLVEDKCIRYHISTFYTLRRKPNEDFMYRRENILTQEELKNMIKRGEIIYLKDNNLLTSIYNFAGLCN